MPEIIPHHAMLFNVDMGMFLRDGKSMLIGYDRGKEDRELFSDILSSIELELFMNEDARVSLNTHGVVAVTASYWHGFLKQLHDTIGTKRLTRQVKGVDHLYTIFFDVTP